MTSWAESALALLVVCLVGASTAAAHDPTPAPRRPGSGRAAPAQARPAAVVVVEAAAVERAAARAGDELPYRPDVEPASDEGRAAMDGFELAGGLTVELFAAEPMLANAVCLALDEQGAVYVGETHRHYAGVADIRDHTELLADDFACETVEQRVALLRRLWGDDFDEYLVEHERIVRLRDTDGDGAADESAVFADGFRDAATGIGAGLLIRNGDVFYTCIPELWRLRDDDGDGRAEVRDVLSTGYGVRIGYLGHDLHGLELGHDGRLYFSIGDRGLHVETDDVGTLHLPDTGAVLRCELDGGGLEIVHIGLRNPQELAFDDWGDLFTGDNNADNQDAARFVRIIEGGDSGWRGPYQWVDGAGAWTGEQLWNGEGTAAYRLPPVGNLANGPSGLAHFEGTGLDPAVYRDHFFLCDFAGPKNNSGVHAFDVVRRGASFELGEIEPLVWGFLATDIETGPDGALYVTDWVRAWSKTGKGRIYRLADPERADDELVVQTRAYIVDGMTGRSADELTRLLAWPDRRVRLEAQLELCARGADGLAALLGASLPGQVEALPGSQAERLAELSRVHAVWGLGVLARTAPALRDAAVVALVERAGDALPEVRAQALAMLGDVRAPEAAGVLGAALGDADPRVQLFAALAAGQVGVPAAVLGLVDVVRAAGEDDLDLRHAAVMGLSGCAGDETLRALMRDENPDVRMAALLVMRRRVDPRLGRFLFDDEPRLAREAARAIHDVPVPGALGLLADALLDDGVHARLARPDERPPEHDDEHDVERAESTWFWRRAINACYRLGAPDRARALGEFALRDDVEAALAAEALECLAAWAEPPRLDRLTGFHWPLPTRDDGVLVELAGELLDAGIVETPDEVLAAWARLVESVADDRGAVFPKRVRASLTAIVEDEDRDTGPRVAALEALVALASPGLQGVVGGALGAADAELRAAALAALEQLDPGEALPRIPALLETGELPEQRVALEILGRLDDEAAESLLVWQLDRLLSDRVPAELSLDLVLAAEARGGVRLTERLERHRAPRDDALLAPWLDALHGGDADRGHEVYRRTEMQCVRCHEVPDDDSPRVGPDLRGVGRRLGRVQLLESIVGPNRRTAPGFGASNLFLADGSVVSGRILDEGSAGVVLVQTADGDLVEVPRAQIDERRAALSAMPEELAAGLDRRAMRDLIEYLSGK